jgi:uncharacterized protein
MEIIQENSTKNGIFKAIENHAVAGEMTYVWAGENKFIIDHTEVFPEFEGKGVGKKLVMEAVEYARANGDFKIMPLCPFAKAVFERTKEIQDVRF